MKHPLHELAFTAVRSYFSVQSAMQTRFKRGALTKNLFCKSQYGLVTVFGWEGDCHAPIAFVDGCYLLRDNGNRLIHFGFEKKHFFSKVDWYNKEGYLPCLVTHFQSGDGDVKIETFADLVTVKENPYEVAYTRVTIHNHGDKPFSVPKASSALTALTDVPKTVAPGGTACVEYAVFADRFGRKMPFPEGGVLRQMGSWQTHYDHMKAYWEQRLSETVQLTLPDQRLVHAYKAGYIYTMIVKDGDCLHVGENGYDAVYDHDIIGITMALLTMGDFRHFKEYVPHILDKVLYPDARWKYSMPFGLYLMKSGDRAYVREMFPEICRNTHAIEADREKNGLMKRTNAIDSLGHWTVDNWSALAGLSSYNYICKTLGESAEAEWAMNLYKALLNACNEQLAKLMQETGIDYIPISMTQTNEQGPRNDPRDANILSMFLFGRWAWEGYLYGMPQYGVMLDKIDSTYDHAMAVRRETADSPVNFGGYPHGWYCSAYNAGYGSAALRGEKHRSLGIEGYLFMIDHAMSGPYAWWEGVHPPKESSVWNRPHAAGGGGSCPHIWGQSTATKVLIDSLIAEKADGTLLLLRGVPQAYCEKGKCIKVNGYPVQGGRVNLTVTFDVQAEITLSGAVAGRKVELTLNGQTESFVISAKENIWHQQVALNTF